MKFNILSYPTPPVNAANHPVFTTASSTSTTTTTTTAALTTMGASASKAHDVKEIVQSTGTHVFEFTGSAGTAAGISLIIAALALLMMAIFGIAWWCGCKCRRARRTSTNDDGDNNKGNIGNNGNNGNNGNGGFMSHFGNFFPPMPAFTIPFGLWGNNNPSTVTYSGGSVDIEHGLGYSNTPKIINHPQSRVERQAIGYNPTCPSFY